MTEVSMILSDLGVTVSYKVVTRTTNGMSGEETTSFAAASNQTVVFCLKQNKYLWEKTGLVQEGDAMIIAPTTLGMKRYDQLTYNGNTYYIENVTRRPILLTSEEVDIGTLFKVA